MALEELPQFVEKAVRQISAERGFTANSDIIVNTLRKCVLGANFNVTVRSPQSQSKLHLFVKCLVKNDSGYSSEAEQYFSNEIVLYGDILNYFLKLQNARTKYTSTSLTCITKCFSVGKQDEPFIIMVDLMKRSYGPLNVKQPLSLKCVREVLKQLGQFHAYSFAVKNQTPRLFACATSKLQETVFHGNIQPTYRKLFLHGVHDALKLAKQNLPHDSVYVRKLSEFLLDIFNKMILLAAGDDEDKPYHVVTHGDLWPNNMLYRFSNDAGDEQPGNVVFVDFQGCRYSSPAHDLIFVLLVGIDQSTREQHLEDLIRTYHTSLCETVEQLGSDPLRLFPYLALQSQIRKHARFALAIALAGLPLYLDEGPKLSHLEAKLQPNANTHEPLDVSIEHIQARKTISARAKCWKY